MLEHSDTNISLTYIIYIIYIILFLLGLLKPGNDTQ